jgi:hypothetical protein
MVVNLVKVLFHFGCQPGSYLATAGLASQMRRVSVELPLEIDQYWATRREFLIRNGLLKLCVALIHLGVECGGIKAFAGYGELVDECEFKISQAFNLRVASGLTESRSAAARNSNRRDAK